MAVVLHCSQHSHGDFPTATRVFAARSLGVFPDGQLAVIRTGASAITLDDRDDDFCTPLHLAIINGEACFVETCHPPSLAPAVRETGADMEQAVQNSGWSGHPDCTMCNLVRLHVQRFFRRYYSAADAISTYAQASWLRCGRCWRRAHRQASLWRAVRRCMLLCRFLHTRNRSPDMPWMCTTFPVISPGKPVSW